MKKQILSLVLCLCMLMSILPASVLAKTDDTISLDISEGSITIENGTDAYTFKVTQGSNTADNIDPATIFEIYGTTTSNTITVSANLVKDGTPLPVKIVLNSVNIDYGCAFRITAEAGAVNLVLADNSSNSFISHNFYAGLQKENSGTGSMLTISGDVLGTGSLTANGSTAGAGIGGTAGKSVSDITITGGIVYANGGAAAAGIGGGYDGGCNNITITGGTVHAVSGGGNGAGIGGGGNTNADFGISGHDGKNITISGGTVIATGSTAGAAIGGGRDGNGENITISGGTVTATGGYYSPGIGGGQHCIGKNIVISGGTVTTTGIGSGTGGGDSAIKITGGNIKTTAISTTPTKSDGTTPVYKATFTVPGATEGTEASGLTISGYGTTGIKTLDTDKVYAYLPANTDGTNTTVTYNSISYLTVVTADGGAVFASIYMESIPTPNFFKVGDKLGLTAPSINNPNSFSISSQGWQIKKTGGTYQEFNLSTTSLDKSYDNASLRYYLTYNDDGSKNLYSNEVILSMGRTAGFVTNISDISKIYDGSAVSAPTYSKNSTGMATFEYKAKYADDSKYSTTKPSSVGDYTVRVSVADDDDYTSASATKDFSISYLTTPSNPFTLSSASNTAGWYNRDVTITPASGYTLSTSLNGTYSSSLTVLETVSDYTVYLKNAQGQMTDAITVGDIKIDKDAPTNISVEYDKDTSFRSFLNTITFGLFFKERITVYLFASDTNSRMKEVKYTLNGTEYTIAANGSASMVSFYIDPQFIGNISGIKAIDNAGNESDEKATEYFAVDSKTPAAPTVYFGGKPTNVWIWEDMNITVSGSSAVSGIAKYQYTTNGGETWIDMTTTEADEATATTPYNAKKASLLLDYDVNALTFSFRAVSNAGNVGAESPGKVVKIDKFKPVMVINGNNSDYKQSDTITFDLEFGNSGIMFMTVCKDYGDRVTITDSYQDGYTVTENGLYLFEVFSMAGKVTSETIYYGNLDSAKPVISINSNGYEEDSWQNNGNVTLNVSNATANLGTTLIQYKVGSGSWQNYTSPIVISNDTAAALYTFKATSASGVVSDEKTLTIKRDTVIPDGDIKIKENSVKKFINTISFGLFFKENVDVTISSTDVTSGVESVKYYRSDRILTQAELNEISSWEDYTGTISETAADAEKFVYYVKVTDYAGNVDLFGSDGVTFDTSAPFVSGIEDGKAYTPDTEVTVSDATDVTVTLNGNSITLQDNKFSLTGQTGSVTVEATDAAGNKTTLAITVNEEGLLIDTVNHPDGSVTVTRTNNDGKVVEILITYSDGSTDQILNNTDGTSVETKKDNSGNVTETTVTQADGSFIKTENKPDGSVVETNMDNSGKVTETTVSQEDGSSVKTENKSDGSVVETKKDSSGEVTETTVTQADGSSVKTENKSDGSVVETKKDGSGNITETTVTQADGSSVKTESKPDGSMVETKKDGSGNVTETTVTQTDGSSVKTENKSDGSVVETKKDNSGAVTEKTVIAANGSKTITIHNADGTTTVTKYDPDGKVINDKDTDNPAVPHTGDSNNMILWIALLFVSGGIIITLDIAGKHRKRRI